MKKRLQIILTFCIAVMLLTSVFAGYFPTPEYVVECTCISNSLIGLLFLFSGIRIIKVGTVFGNWLYGTASVTLLFVFLICMGSLAGAYQMNFKGAFFFEVITFAGYLLKSKFDLFCAKVDEKKATINVATIIFFIVFFCQIFPIFC